MVYNPGPDTLHVSLVRIVCAGTPNKNHDLSEDPVLGHRTMYQETTLAQILYTDSQGQHLAAAGNRMEAVLLSRHTGYRWSVIRSEFIRWVRVPA